MSHAKQPVEMKLVMDAHGSHVAMPVDGSAPGGSVQLLRGSFAIVRYDDRTRPSRTYIVLQGLEPENRQLVYESGLGTDLEGAVLILRKAQDNPGMAHG